MPSFFQTIFGGIRPGVSDHNLEQRYARVAHNVVLRDGTLRALRKPRFVTPGQDTRTIWRFNDMLKCCGPVRTWDHCVFVLPDFPGPQTCHDFEHHVLFYPECRTPPQRYFACTGEYFPLLVARPTTSLIPTRIAAGTLQNHPYAGPDARSYTYTWVDDFTVESAPAPPSTIVKSYDDEVWQLSYFDTPPPNAKYVRIYRSSSFFESGEQIRNPFNTTFQLVAEVPLPLPGGVFIDDRKLIDLDYGSLLTEEDCDPPCMTFVTATDAGYAVGFKDNDIYFSQRYEPHNWPMQFRTTLPHKIVALVTHGDIVYVATTGKPYRINTAPTQQEQPAELDLTIDPYPYDENFPCVAQHSMVATNFGALYASHKGLVSLQLRGAAQLITRGRIDEADWSKYSPNLAAWWNGKYVGLKVPTGQGIIIDVPDPAEGERMDLGDIVTMDIDAQALHAGRDGRLYFANQQGVYAFDEGTDLHTYEYLTRKFLFPALVGMTAAKIVGDFGPPVRFELYANDRLVYVTTVKNSKPFRLPHHGRHLEYQVRLTGQTRVRELHVGTSVFDLTETRSSA